MYKAACSESALRPFRVFLWQIKSNLKATVIYETICVMLHHETASGLRSFSTRAALAEAEDFYQEHRLHMSICVALLYRERGHNAFKSDHMLKMTNSLRKFLTPKHQKQISVLRNHCTHKLANWSRASLGLQQIRVAGRNDRRGSCRIMMLWPVYSPLIALA